MAQNTASRRNWEDTFTSWGQPPSTTEQEKCARAETVIKNALKNSVALKDRTIRVFAQGSYRNNTSERRESDVDVCVMCTDVCFTDFTFAPGLSNEVMGHADHPYTYAQFKNEVGHALTTLGSGSVTRGNKAFDVHANTYRVDADVVPCFEHLRYLRDSNGQIKYERGTELHPDNGGRIINWPEQHYGNGVSKNERTGKKFKPLVRIFKSLRTEMTENKIADAENVPSFLLECLVWNVPDSTISSGSTWAERVRAALLFIYEQIQQNNHTEWGEVSELKYLFNDAQAWRPKTASEFVCSAWNYLGF